MIIANFIWQHPNGGPRTTQRLDLTNTTVTLLDTAPETGEIVEFQLLYANNPVIKLGCCGARIYSSRLHNKSKNNGYPDRGGRSDDPNREYGHNPKVRFDSFDTGSNPLDPTDRGGCHIRVFVPSFLLSDTRGLEHRAVCALEFWIVTRNLAEISILPWARLAGSLVEMRSIRWSIPLLSQPDLAGMTAGSLDRFLQWIGANLQKKTLSIDLPLSSAAESILGLRPTPEIGPGNPTAHESPMRFSWIKERATDKWVKLSIDRTFEGNPASGVGFFRRGRSALTQGWTPGVANSRPSWWINATNNAVAPDHLEYLEAAIRDSVKGTSHLTSMPLFRKPPTGHDHGRKLRIEVQLAAPDPELSANDIHFVPMLPDPSGAAAAVLIALPGIRSTGGAIPEFSSMLTKIAPPSKGISKVEGVPYCFDVVPSSWQGTWREKQKCLVGSLGLWMGGTAEFPVKTAKLSYFLAPVTYAEDLSRRGTGGRVRAPRCIGFQVGEPGTTGFLEDSGTLDLPIYQAKPVAIELTGAQSDLLEDTQPPLLIPLEGSQPDPLPELSNRLTLRMAERRVPGSPERMSLRLDFGEVPQRRPLPRNRILYLDRHPFSVALLDFEHLYNFDYHGGKELAYWSTEGVHRGWQLRCTSEEITLWLPPQGLGEAMEKDRTIEGDIKEEFCASIRFTPNAKLELRMGEQARRYGLSPTFLRDLLGGMQNNRLVGLPLKSARFELLYGLAFEIRGVPWVRIAELFSRLGLPPRPLPREPRSLDHSDRNSLEQWVKFREAWEKRLGAISRRLGVYEVFDDRQEDFKDNGEPLGLQLRGDQKNRKLRAWLRKDADIKPSFPKLPGSPSIDPKAVSMPYAKDGLAGSFAWAFESRLLYEALGNGYSSENDVESFESVLTRLYFSALGGWGTQQASFDNGRAIIAVSVEMGRVSELRVERIGRIKCTCNRAKLVTIFRRTVLGSTQFHFQQDPQEGRPLLRKCEEYVEFLEKHRPFPDPQTRLVNVRMAGCAVGCSCDEKIPVDSRWGTDVYRRDGTPHGWRLPLMVAGANKGIYGKANVLIHVHADAATGHAEDTGRVINLENLEFWTDVTPTLSADTDKWPMVHRLDIGSFNPTLIDVPDQNENKGIFHNNSMGAAAVPRGAAEFTLHLAGFTRGANLVGHLHDDMAGEAAPKISAVLRTITLCRGTVPPAGELSAIEKFAGNWADVRADVESFLHACEEIADGDPLNKQGMDELKRVADTQWKNLLASKISSGESVSKLLDTMHDTLSEGKADAERLAQSLRHDIAWRLEQGRSELNQLVDGIVEKLPEPKTPEEIGKWVDLQLAGVKGNIVCWKAELTKIIGQGTESGISKIQAAGEAINAGQVDVQKAKEMLSDLNKAVAGSLTRVSENSATGAELRLASLFKNLNTIIQDASQGKAVTGKQIADVARELKGKAEDLLKKLPEVPKLKAWMVDAVTVCHQMAASDGSAVAERAQYLKIRMTELEGLMRAEAEDLLGAIKASGLARLGGIDGLGKKVAGIGDEIGKILDGAKVDLGEIRETFQNISDRVAARISTMGGFTPPAVEVVSGALEVFRAFGKVPAVPMLGFEDMASLGDAKKELQRRFQSVAYGFSPLLQGGEDLRKEMSEYYKKLAIPELAEAASAQIRSYVNDARKLVRIEPSVKSLVDRAKNAKGEIVEEIRLKGAAIEANVNEITNRLVTDAEQAAKRKLKELLPDFGGMKLEKLLGTVGVSPAFAERLKEKTTTTHGFDTQTMSGFIDCKVDNLDLDGEPTLFAFGPMAMRLSRPVLKSHLRVNSERGTIVNRTEEGTITADWQMCFGGTPMVTFREAKLQCINGKISMDLDPSKLEMNGLLKAISEMIAASEGGEGAGGDEEDEKPFSAGIINEFPAGVTAFCRLRLTLPDLAAGTFAMTNISLGAYFEVSIRLPALEKYIPPKPTPPPATPPGGAPQPSPETKTIDDINNNDMVDPDLRLSPIEGGGSMRPQPSTPDAEGGGLLNGAYFRIAAGLNISSREAPFNITVFILGGCGWFILDVEYMVPLANGKPRMSCYLSAGIGVSAGLALNLGFLKGGIFVSLALEGECLVRTGVPNMYRFGVVLTFAGHVSILCIASASLVIVLAVRYETGGQLSGEGYVRLKIKICWCFTLKVNRGFTYKFGKVEKTSSTETTGPGGKSISYMRDDSEETRLAGSYHSLECSLESLFLDRDTLREASRAAAMFA